MFRKILAVVILAVAFVPLTVAIALNGYHDAFHTHQIEAGKRADAELRSLWLPADSSSIVASVWYDSDHAAFIASVRQADRCWMQDLVSSIESMLPYTTFSLLFLLLLLPGVGRETREESTA